VTKQDIQVKTRLICMSLVLSGCASDPVPDAQMQLTTQSIAQARAVGADNGDALFKHAEDGLALAQKNMSEGDYKRARTLAEQAELDARLAEVTAMNAKVETQLLELSAQIKRLRLQLGDAM
jgi:hypothetical protein